MRTLWLKNKDGKVWDLVTRKVEFGHTSFAFNINQFDGYSDDLLLTQVESNFVVDGRTPIGSEITATLLFANHEHIKLFNEFIRELDDLKLYYDPQGLILPQTKGFQAWYKSCAFASLGVPTKGSHGKFECGVNFKFLTAKWQRDTVLSSILMGVQGKPTTIPFVMPFYFYSAGKIGLMIDNQYDETSCVVSIVNQSNNPFSKCAWQVEYENKSRQLAEWLAGQRKLRVGERLLVDSTPGNELAYTTINNTIENANNHQNIGTRYENFVSIKHGKNTILFDFGGISLETEDGDKISVKSVDIEVTYKQQIRMGLTNI